MTTHQGIETEIKELIFLKHKKEFVVSVFDIISDTVNGTPLQYSCLENPMDGGAWKAAVHGVAKSQTWLKRLHFNFSL